MSIDRLYLPGPTYVPQEVINAMSQPMIGHLEKEYSEVLKSVNNKCKKIFQTNNDVLMLTSSGTGAMEAAISTTLSKGDKVIAMVGGNYGERFARIGENYHLNVIRLNSTWGEALELTQLERVFAQDEKQEIKAVLVTHNETSTGVTNDIKKISRIRGNHPALIIVEAISSIGGIELKVDEWELDVVLTASQNALMLPPGLSLLTFSERAWKMREFSDLPNFYFDLKEYKESLEEAKTPYTPAIPLIRALDVSADLILKEGLENIFFRHERMRDMLRAGLKAMNLNLLAPEEVASSTLTSTIAPKGIEVEELRDYLREKFRVFVGGGQKKLEDKIFRVGHMGYTDETDILTFLSTLEIALKDLGHEFELGCGVLAAQKKYLEK